MEKTGEREEHLIVGLGNPESEYGDTRHNLGFACVRALAERLDAKIDRKRWRSLVGRSESRAVWFVLPQTYMNLSGDAVKAAMRDTGVPASRVWVVHDELDLPLCRLRIQRGRSGAGHNGVLSIISALGTKDFARFRVGIGRPSHRSSGVGVRYVLGRFTKAESDKLEKVVAGVADALELALEAGLERAADRYNRAGALGCEEPE
ncbi:MAG TPA: aminoacyl-tRNA hydrolase [Candidatus Dormibacteraeota bacterium]|nr:aminoacyl-tRNA hydrolase [Candidatus Dormibacteraeota bacterium]